MHEPGVKPSTPNCGRRHRLSARDAARGTIDAARGRMIDRRGSLVKAETEGGVLLRRAMATSRKCVLRPCSLDEPRVSPPPPVLTFDTANLEARATPPGVVVWRVQNDALPACGLVGTH